jgi:uncharacterized membrane protein YdjX (TVP38/TMEM64 family)
MNQRIGLVLLFLLLVILLPFGLWEEIFTQLSEDWLDPDRAQIIIALVVIALLAVDVLLPIPSSMVSIAAGAYFGFVTGSLLILTGMILGCLLGYLLGRFLNQRLLGRLLNPSDEQRTQYFYQRYGLAALTLARPLPVLAEISVILAGISRISLMTVLIYTLPANIIIALAYAGGADMVMQMPVTYPVIIASGIIAVTVVVLAWRRWKTRKVKRE